MGGNNITERKEWTEARFRSFITSALRSASNRYPPKWEAHKEAFVGKKINKATGRLAMHFECNMCKKHFPNKEVQVDHIDPVVDPIKGFQGWDVFVERMFVKKDGYQVLCKQCHKEKTRQEREIRNKYK